MTGDVSFVLRAIDSICRANGLPDGFFADEDALAGLLTAWYRVHRAAGGALDPVQEDLIAEAAAEAAAGQAFSYAPGPA